ncbi:hypothetical protein ACSBR2_032804 [Camellia fascicularis]
MNNKIMQVRNVLHDRSAPNPLQLASVDMPRSATPEQQQRPPTKTLCRCGRFELRVTKIRRRRVTPSISCGQFNLRCSKSREARIHLRGPPFPEGAFKMKQKTGHTPDSIASSCGENDVAAQA